MKGKVMSVLGNDNQVCVGAGAVVLAEVVMRATQQPSNFKFLYDLDLPLKEKIKAIACKMYGAVDVEFSERANKKLETYTALGF